MTHIGFPHSDIHGSKLSSSSPWLFAGKHVLHRLLVPRHPPYALSNLTFLVPRSAPKEHSAVGCACPSRSRVLSFGSPPDKGWSTLVVGLFSLDSEILSVMFAPQTSPPGRSRLCTPRATDVADLGCSSPRGVDHGVLHLAIRCFSDAFGFLFFSLVIRRRTPPENCRAVGTMWSCVQRSKTMPVGLTCL